MRDFLLSGSLLITQLGLLKVLTVFECIVKYVYIHSREQEAQLSQRDRAAACLNFDKNISANRSLYVRALTSTDHHFTVLRHHVCT